MDTLRRGQSERSVNLQERVCGTVVRQVTFPDPKEIMLDSDSKLVQ